MAEDDSTGTPRGEGNIFGASGILGVNNLQRAIDTFDTTVGKLQGIIGKLGEARATYQGAEGRVMGSWNRQSNWGGTNGGQPPNNGQPPAGGGGQPPTPNGGGGSFGGVPVPVGAGGPGHGLPSGASGNGGVPNNPAPVPSGSPTPRREPLSKPARAVAAAGSISGAYQMLTQPKSESNNDSLLYNAVSSYYTMSASPHQIAMNSRRMFNYNNWARDGADAAAAHAQIMSQAGGVVGSDAEKSMTNAAAQISYGNVTLGASKSAQVATRFYGGKGYIGLRQVGVQTIGAHGKRQSPTMIANQVLKQIDPNEMIRSADDAEALLTDQMSNLNMTLSNWISNGIIDGDQSEAIKDSIRNILKARAHGVSASKLNTLLNQNAAGSKKARHVLRDKLGVANSDIQDNRDVDAAKRQGTVDRVEEFDKNLKKAADAVEGFTNRVRDVTSNPKNPIGRRVGNIVGHIRAWGSQGPLGIGLGAVHALWGGIHGGGDKHSSFNRAISPGGLWHGVQNIGHGAKWVAGTHWADIGIGDGKRRNDDGDGRGGDNESRMSVLAMRGHGSGSSGPVDTSSASLSAGGGLSGTPHNAGAAAMGGDAVGGPRAADGGPGKAKSSKGGQRMILPARGTLGAYFGQRGSHWASGHHTGQDIRCPTGTSVHAPANGTVIFAGWNSAYGNLIKIDHGKGVVSYMAHNSRLVKHVGAKVRQGQLIAYSGATGNVTGPHCHFEVRVNGRSVDPMGFVTGGRRVSGKGGGAGTAGDGTNAPNGSGADFTDSTDGGGGGMAGGGTIGMSEIDVLGSIGGSEAASFGGGGSSSGGGGGGGGDTSTPGGGGTTPGPGTKGLKGNRKTVNKEAAKYGWGSGAQWNTLVNLIMGESGFRNTAQNPTSTAYGMFQFLDGTWASYGGHKTSDPHLQSVYGMKYIKRRYGSPIAAKRKWDSRHPHWYDKGAWELPEDETARVHKGEMIVPKKEADQIREILVNGNPYRAKGNQGKASSGAAFTFDANSINITVTSTGNPTSDGQAIGKAFLDTLQQNARIKGLQTGVNA